MTLKDINDELHRQAKDRDESRANMEAQVCRLRVLLRETEHLAHDAKKSLERELQHFAHSCESEWGGLDLLGELDWSGLRIHWEDVVIAQNAFRKHQDACEEMRRTIDDKLSILNDSKLWEAATSGDRITKSFAWSRIKEETK